MNAPGANNLPATDPLAGLRDIHLPADVPAWPPGPGWWLLAALLLVLAIMLFVLHRRRQRNAWQREAQQLLADDSGSDAQWAQRQLAVLRRVLLALHAPQDVAGRAGPALLDWLAAHGMQADECAAVARLQHSAWSGDVIADRAATSALLQQWLRRQQRAGRTRERAP